MTPLECKANRIACCSLHAIRLHIFYWSLNATLLAASSYFRSLADAVLGDSVVLGVGHQRRHSDACSICVVGSLCSDCERAHLRMRGAVRQ
eukprot:4130107-Pleurochrysis_carterae.AAC.1